MRAGPTWEVHPLERAHGPEDRHRLAEAADDAGPGRRDRTAGDRQVVFIDTPGLHSPRTALGDFMVKTAQENIEDTDIVLLVVEARDYVHKLERDVIDRIKRTGQKSILVINKVDTVKDKPRILAAIQAFFRPA